MYQSDDDSTSSSTKPKEKLNRYDPDEPITDLKEFLHNAKAEFYSHYFSKRRKASVGAEDFYFIKTIGTGAFGRVQLIQKKSNGKYFAVKIISKQMLVRTKQVTHALDEKNILKSLWHPFTVNLEYFFQDNVYVFYVLPLVEGGELYMYLHEKGKFDENLSQFYAAQVLLALEYLHYLDLVYRDLKPEHLLIDRHGFIKLTDFGFCKQIKHRTYTLCGTPEYIAPEVLLSKGYGKTCDYWSFGILLYELNSGRTPFYSKEAFKIYEKITLGRFKYQTYFSSELRDIIRNLLQVDLTRRYGNLKRGIRDIKEHKWFKHIDWLQIFNKNIKPPYVPELDGTIDTKHFEQIKEIPLTKKSIDTYAREFANF